MSPLITTLYVIGITAEAMTAALSAGRQKLDLFGVILIASITALGGGTVRDIVLQHYPIRWVNQPVYLLIVVCAALFTMSLSFLMHYFRHVFLIADAIGLAVFSMLGAQVALHLDLGLLIAVVAAIITGVFGGILRDLLSDRVPLVFSGEYYAAISVLATLIFWGLMHLSMPEEAAAITTVVIAFVCRLLAIHTGTGLPVFEYQDENQPIDPRLRLSARIMRDGARAAKRRASNSLRFDAAAYASVNRQTGKHARHSRAADTSQQWQVERDNSKRPKKHGRKNPPAQ